MLDNAFCQLRAISWLPEPVVLSAAALSWLAEQNSLTKRFMRHCQRLSVSVQREEFILCEAIQEERHLLPLCSRYWLREVILSGDGQAWLAARTVIPESTLSGPEEKLRYSGNTPLGQALFSSPALTRDFIEYGQAASLWARRSRLCLSGKPLLLTELFLPDAPLYRDLLIEESV